MADSVVEIVNTTLTSTELPDSTTSYNLITTDANTSYVIKDVQTFSYVDDLQAKVNGFPVGNWAQNLTGSEVIDVSSTVSVTSADVPLVNDGVLEVYTSFNDVLYIKRFGYLNGTLAKTTTETVDIRALGWGTIDSLQNSGTSNVYSTIFSADKTKALQLRMNNGGATVLAHWTDPDTQTTVFNVNNNMAWISPQDGAAYYRDSATEDLKKIDVETGVTSTVATGVFSFGTPTFDLDRKTAIHDNWLFYIPGNTFTSDLYAVNANNGYVIHFDGNLTNMAAANAIDQGTSLAVSYDRNSDTYYIYRSEGLASYKIYRDKLPLTKTQMDAVVVNTTNTDSTTDRNSSTYDTQITIASTTYAPSKLMGHPSVGRRFFYVEETTNIIYLFDSYRRTTFTPVKLTDPLTPSGVQAEVVSATTYKQTAAQETAFWGSDPTEIKIKISGVKTVA